VLAMPSYAFNGWRALPAADIVQSVSMCYLQQALLPTVGRVTMACLRQWQFGCDPGDVCRSDVLQQLAMTGTAVPAAPQCCVTCALQCCMAFACTRCVSRVYRHLASSNRVAWGKCLC
jgi:hypothetical protein